MVGVIRTWAARCRWDGHSHLAARNVDPGSKPSSGFLGVIALLYGASDADQGGESSTFLPV